MATYPPIPKVTDSKSDKYVWPIETDKEEFNSDDTATKNLFHVDYLKQNFNDFARSNLFKVNFIIPETFQKDYIFSANDRVEQVEMTAKTCNIPNFEMGRLEIKRMGQRIIIPSTMNLGDCQFTFICDDNYKQRKFLHSWFHKIVYNNDLNVYRKLANLNYCTMQIFQLDNKFNVTFGVQLSHCWPSSIGEIQFSQDSENQVTDFPASFAYSTYEILSPESDTKE